MNEGLVEGGVWARDKIIEIKRKWGEEDKMTKRCDT
jgi:hypothetical protein